MIDQTGHARLADFGLLSIISDPKYLLSSSSHTQGGTARWMSPERFDPGRFGLKDGRPTKPSDCYALGMVIYEITTGNLPFHKHADFIVIPKVLEGERPPRGANFTKDLWEMLERCWASEPSNRPSIEDVLQCLEVASDSSEPPSPRVDDGVDADGDGWNTATSSSGGGSFDSFATSDHVQSPPINSLQDNHLTDDLTSKHNLLSAEHVHHLQLPNIDSPPAQTFATTSSDEPSCSPGSMAAKPYNKWKYLISFGADGRPLPMDRPLFRVASNCPSRLESPEPASPGPGGSNLGSVHQPPTAVPAPPKHHVDVDYDEDYDEGVAEMLMDLATYRTHVPAQHR